MAINKENIAGVKKDEKAVLSTTLSALQQSIAQLNGLLITQMGGQVPATNPTSTTSGAAPATPAALPQGGLFGAPPPKEKNSFGLSNKMFGGLSQASQKTNGLLSKGFAALGMKKVANESASAVKKGSPETYYLGLKLDALRSKDGKKKKEGSSWWKMLLGLLAGIGKLFSFLVSY